MRLALQSKTTTSFKVVCFTSLNSPGVPAIFTNVLEKSQICLCITEKNGNDITQDTTTVHSECKHDDADLIVVLRFKVTDHKRTQKQTAKFFLKAPASIFLGHKSLVEWQQHIQPSCFVWSLWSWKIQPSGREAFIFPLKMAKSEWMLRIQSAGRVKRRLGLKPQNKGWHSRRRVLMWYKRTLSEEEGTKFVQMYSYIR